MKYCPHSDGYPVFKNKEFELRLVEKPRHGSSCVVMTECLLPSLFDILIQDMTLVYLAERVWNY